MNFIFGSSGFLTRSLLNDMPDKFNEKSLLSLRKSNKNEIIEYVKTKVLGKSNTIVFAGWPTNLNYDDIGHLNFLKDEAIPLIKGLVDEIPNVRIITYGTCLEYGLLEGELKENRLAIPCTKLGTAKLMLYDQCRSLIKEGNFIHLRIFYPYSHGNPREGSFVYLLKKALNLKQKEFNMSIGTQKRDFFKPKLLSKVVSFLIDKDFWEENLINIGSCKPTSVIDIAKEHMKFSQNKIQLITGKYELPWYEPYVFYAGHTNSIKQFLS